MLGSQCLFLPESGPEFVSSAKMGVLYGDRPFYSFLKLTDVTKGRLEEMVGRSSEILSKLSGAPETVQPSLRRAIAYARFTLDFSSTLELLEREGLAGSYDLDAVRELLKKPQEAAHTEYDFPGLLQRLQNRDDPNVQVLRSVRAQYPPGFLDVLPTVLVIGHVTGYLGEYPPFARFNTNDISGIASAISDPQLELPLFAVYLAVLSDSAHSGGSTLVAASMAYLKAVEAARSLLAPGIESRYLSGRRSVGATLAERILVRHIPKADDLEFEELLEVRTRYSSKLQRFRDGVASLATDIDLDLPTEKLTLQIEDLITRRVDPEIARLKAALSDARINALKKSSPEWSSAARQLAAVGLGIVGGAPVKAAALAALPALGSIAQILVFLAGGEYERRKEVRSNPWAVVVKLQADDGLQLRE